MKLTKRKLEVLRLIVDGKSNGQIAVILGISVNTVAVHRASIMKEMGVHKTADLVVSAIRKSLVCVSLRRNMGIDAEAERRSAKNKVTGRRSKRK